MLSRKSSRGFTLIELLVAMSILAILVALGAPSLARYLQNSKLANAAAGYFSGVQLARAEAIRRNVPAQFVLTDTVVSTANLANALLPSVVGRNWVVRAASGAGTFEAVEAKAGAEGESSNVTQAVQVAGIASAPVVFDGTITFNGFGATTTGVSYEIDITNPVGGTCAAVGGPIRCRRITVSAGGQIAVCDRAAPVGDSRACP